jgi:hypothetical protein
LVIAVPGVGNRERPGSRRRRWVKSPPAGRGRIAPVKEDQRVDHGTYGAGE